MSTATEAAAEVECWMHPVCDCAARKAAKAAKLAAKLLGHPPRPRSQRRARTRRPASGVKARRAHRTGSGQATPAQRRLTPKPGAK